MVPDRLTVGRAPTNSIQLEDETVSSLHAEIVSNGGGKYIVRDLGSKNGTFVDGAAITEVEMSGPCKIGFGAVQFEVRASEPLFAAPVESGGTPLVPEREAPLPERIAAKSSVAPDWQLVSEELRQKLSDATSRLESERREFAVRAEEIARQHEAGLSEKNRESAALGSAFEDLKSSSRLESELFVRKIDDLKSAHASQIEAERLERAEEMARINLASEERLQDALGKAALLSDEIEGLKKSHCGELEAIRQESVAHIASLESLRQAAAKEQNEMHNSLAAEIENQRAEHEAKLADVERAAAERIGNLEERCEALARGVEEIKAGNESQLAAERAAHAEEIRASEARVDAKKEECVALARQIEALKSALESKIEAGRKVESAAVEPQYSANLQAERRVLSTFSDRGAFGRRVKVALPIGKFASLIRRKLSNRTEIGASLGALLWVGFMGSGLYLIKPSAPFAHEEKSGSLTSLLSAEKPSPAFSKQGEGKPQAATAHPAVPSANFTATLPSLDESGGGIDDKRANSSTPANSNTGGVAHVSGGRKSEAAPDSAPINQGDALKVPDAAKVADAAKASAATKDAEVLCPCAGGETQEPPKSEAASTPPIAEGPAPADKDGMQEKPIALPSADLAIKDQNPSAEADPSGSGFQKVGFRLQREESPRAASENTASDTTADKSDKSDKSDPSGAEAPVKSKDNGKRGLRAPDLAKNEPPASLSSALRRKEGFDKGSPKAADGLRVLILGDSLSLCGFGKRLDSKFRADSQVQAVYTYMACGVNPLSWIKEKPYLNVKTRCGFWSIESSAGQPKDMEDVYGMKPGSVPKSHPVPKVEDLLEATHPDILVMQCGTNLFELFANRTAPDSNKDVALVRKYIAPFFDAVRKCPSLRKIYWVSPPTSGRTSNEIQEFVFSQTRACSGDLATVIDSRSLVTYPYHMMEPDHEHFLGTDMTQWADRVFSLVKQDYSSKPFSSFPLVADLEMPAAAKSPQKADSASATAPLAIKAKLSFKSPPIPIKELLPYQESLVGFVYDVDQVVAGKYEEKQILVLHPACIGLKPQPLEKYKMGKVYTLRLNELEATAWHTVKSQDQSGRIDLIPYIQVEDEKKYPGNTH